MYFAVIGTGYLGRTVVAELKNCEMQVVHTYNSQKYFSDSIQLDLFSQNLGDTISIKEIDVVIFTSMIEDALDTEAVLEAMRRAFLACKDKRVVYISTDAVFDGKKGKYTETDLPTPITPYGKHKKFCEDLLQQIVSDYCIIRPNYIYGFSLGKLDNRLDKAYSLAQSGQSIKKFVDMFKSPTEVNQLAKIITTVSKSDFRGILHACGNRLSVYEFFEKALKALGQTPHMIPDHVPENPPLECLVDTSLDSGLLKNIFGIEPVEMEVALSGSKK